MTNKGTWYKKIQSSYKKQQQQNLSDPEKVFEFTMNQTYSYLE